MNGLDKNGKSCIDKRMSARGYVEDMISTYFFGLIEKVLRILIGTVVPGNTWYTSAYEGKIRQWGLMIRHFSGTA
jgi:hypothetical protein